MRTSEVKNYFLSFASATAIAFASVPVTAQEEGQSADDDSSLDEIVVTGIRASIMNSIERKRNASSIVEAISAEDIGKLPDASIGESLARLPGLAAQRLDGRANKISIRGLAPDFTTTSLNGREMVSSDSNRAVEYDQFPSELITGATVYKTPDASITTQAIGGTVDMQTVRPLSYKEPVFAVGFRGEFADVDGVNAGTSKWGYRGNIAYIGQNDAGTLGYAIGYSRMVQPIHEEWIHHWDYELNKPSLPEGVDALRGAKLYKKANILTRDGVLGVVEFKPNDSISSRIDVFYSKFEDEQTLRGMDFAGDGSSDVTVLESSNGLVTRGIWQNVRSQNRNDFSLRDAETFTAGWNTEWVANDNWTVELDLSYSTADRNFESSEVYLAQGRGGSGPGADIEFFLTDDGYNFNSPVDYSDTSLWSLGDNLGWGGPLCTAANGWASCNSQDLFRNTQQSSDDLYAVKLAAERQVNSEVVSSIKFGARYAVRDKANSQLGEWAALSGYPDLAAIPAEFLEDRNTSLDFAGDLGDIISFDPRAVWNSGLYDTPTPHQFELSKQQASNWTVEEKVLNLYVMADIETDTITGNIGVQAVYTDQSSTGHVGDQSVGFFDDPASFVAPQITQGTDYWEWLPSMNLSYNIDDDNKLRLGVARIMARPRMDQMNAGRFYSFDVTNLDGTTLENSPWGGEGGNPNLRAMTAWQFDLGYEHYFGQGGYVSIAGFYKKLDGFFYENNVAVDFSGVPVPDALQPAIFEGLIKAPDNGEGGKIYGVELSTSVPFENFSDALNGFGFLGSASFTDSSVRETEDSPALSLPGLSKTVLNGTLYFEKSGFQARVSARYRSSYLSEVFGLSQSREERRTAPETIIDAQVSYDLDDLGVEGMTMYLQASNLTNEPFKTFEGEDNRRVRNWHSYGRSFMFGFSYKM